MEPAGIHWDSWCPSEKYGSDILCRNVLILAQDYDEATNSSNDKILLTLNIYNPKSIILAQDYDEATNSSNDKILLTLNIYNPKSNPNPNPSHYLCPELKTQSLPSL